METHRVHLNIPVAHFQPVLTWDQETVDYLVERAVNLAVEVGLRLDQDREGVYLREAESKGAKIAWDARAVLFTREQVEETMEVMRRTAPASAPLRPALRPEDPASWRDVHVLLGNGANLLFDRDSWQAKAPERRDLVELCRWVQGYDEAAGVFAPVMLKDVDLRLEPLYSYALMGKYCRKAVYHNQPTQPLHVKYLDRMSSVYQKHRGMKQPMPMWEYVNPPFRLSQRAVETMLARVDSGICEVMGIGPMSVAGLSAPVTVVGLAVTVVAEMLAALTFFRILRPGYGLQGNVCAGSLDLRTARVSYFGMHTHLGNLAGWELVVRGIGAEAPCLTWYRDANEPGMQALYEFGMAQAFFSAVLHHCTPEIGGLCCGNVFSPHQAVLDLGIIKEFNELAAGFEVSEEALGWEEIIAARFDQGRHVGSEHTLKYMMDGVPFSDLLFRGFPAAARHHKDQTQTDELMEKAAASVRASMEKGAEVEPDHELADELYECVREAAAEWGLEAPPLP